MNTNDCKIIENKKYCLVDDSTHYGLGYGKSGYTFTPKDTFITIDIKLIIIIILLISIIIAIILKIKK